MEALVELLTGTASLSEAIARAGLIAARLGPLTVIAPWLGLRSAPATVRSALILALTVAFYPLALGLPFTAPPNAIAYAAAGLREALLGTAFALAVALPLHALDWAGRLVDSWRGAGLAEVLSPATGERTSPLGDLLLMAGVVLFIAVGAHRLALAAFAESLRLAPIGAPALLQSAPSLAFGAIELTGSALALAAAIAAPAAVAIVLVEVALGLVGRSAPQLPVFFAGMPLRAATGLAALLLGLAVTLDQLPQAFEAAITSAKALLASP